LPNVIEREKTGMDPVLLEVVAPVQTGVELSWRGWRMITDWLGLKGKYRNECEEEYPEDWKEARAYLSSWIQEIAHLYRHRIRIRVIDAMSPMGLWKQLRHRVYRFPAFIVDNRHTYIGWNPRELEDVIDKQIHKK